MDFKLFDQPKMPLYIAMLYLVAGCSNDSFDQSKKSQRYTDVKAAESAPVPESSEAQAQTDPAASTSPNPLPPAADASSTLVIGALGDSITRAFNSNLLLSDNPSISWTTGDKPEFENGSHYARFQNELGVKTISALNMAVTGATSKGLSVQVDKLVPYKPDYVTILIGANDVCGWSKDYEESLGAYKSSVQSAVDRLIKANANVRINLVPAPDMVLLYELKKDVPLCKNIWALAGGCRMLLSDDPNVADRATFKVMWQSMNDSLRDISAADSEHLHFSERVAGAILQKEHISSLDCFHPSSYGQHIISDMSWDQSFAAQALK